VQEIILREIRSYQASIAHLAVTQPIGVVAMDLTPVAMVSRTVASDVTFISMRTL